jgi:hypothetical protein
VKDWDIIARTNALERRVARATAPVTHAEQRALDAAQARHDSVAAHVGGPMASAATMGETPLEYRRRLLAPHAARDPRFTHSRVSVMDSATLGMIEAQVYGAAIERARTANTPGTLREVQERDAAGRLISRYYGDIGVAFGTFMQHGITGRVTWKS